MKRALITLALAAALTAVGIITAIAAHAGTSIFMRG